MKKLRSLSGSPDSMQVSFESESDKLATGEQLDRLDCIRLALLIGEGGLTGRIVRQMAARAGGFKPLLNLSMKTFLELVGGPPDRVEKLTRLLRGDQLSARLQQSESICERNAIQTIVCTDPAYPERLKQIGNYPTVLFWRGQPLTTIVESSFLATIVGTRKPTGYGRIMTERIAGDLARAGLLIVSGLALGIDSLAHKAALDAGRPTIGVLACGVDITYPPQNAALMARIIETGIVMSEHAPGTPPIKSFFPARNRILSGLSDAVIVTEASMKSGSMITASFAADQGRDVFAMPGNVLSLESEGCNQLIREGAFLLTRAEDVLWRIPTAQRMDSLSAAIRGDDPVDIESEICQTLAGGALTIDDLAVMLDREIAEMLCLLSDLEIRGRVQRERGRFALTV